MKLILSMVLGLPMLFGFMNVGSLMDNKVFEDYTPTQESFSGSYCHNDDFTIDYMLEKLGLEDKTLALYKLDEILITNDVSLESFEESPHDYPLIMHEFMDYLIEEGYVETGYHHPSGRHHRYQ